MERLSEIKTPTLLFVGDRDLQDIIKVAEIIESSIRNVKKIEYSGTGHMLTMEKPGEFNRIVLHFLNEQGGN